MIYIFIHLVHYVKTFYDNYIETENRTRYIDDGGSGGRPKQFDMENNLKNIKTDREGIYFNWII